MAWQWRKWHWYQLIITSVHSIISGSGGIWLCGGPAPGRRGEEDPTRAAVTVEGLRLPNLFQGGGAVESSHFPRLTITQPAVVILGEDGRIPPPPFGPTILSLSLYLVYSFYIPSIDIIDGEWVGMETVEWKMEWWSGVGVEEQGIPVGRKGPVPACLPAGTACLPAWACLPAACTTTTTTCHHLPHLPATHLPALPSHPHPHACLPPACLPDGDGMDG